MMPRGLRAFLVGLLTLLLVVVGPPTALQAAGSAADLFVAQGHSEMTDLSASAFIPIAEQPFYPELLVIYRRWGNAPLSRVVGDSPRETLLNFYAVMARIYDELQLTTQSRNEQTGLFWNSTARKHIATAEELFALAIQSLDASIFPESVRSDMAQEAAIQLKEVLDYVLTHSTVPIEIPDHVGLKTLNEQRSKSSETWTLPHTTIALSADLNNLEGISGFLFSGTTASNISRMYNQIHNVPVVEQPLASPGFYSKFIYTPGFLAPPLWYLRLPPDLRGFLETPLDGQSLFQVITSLGIFFLFCFFLIFVLRSLLRTYSYIHHGSLRSSSATLFGYQLPLSWYRVVLVFPLFPLSRFSEILIDDYINITGIPLRVVTYLLFFAYFVSAGCFFFYLFEAFGCTISRRLVQWRGGGSELQLRRVNNLVMPLCRVLGSLVAVFMFYRLLVVLGLPPTTVLAFSAVPGLAIGLGASKLLGNLFGGLSIQTDRPVRVGEFCRIGENLGFVSKIGMRSLELQTLESRITIPNSIVDEQTIVNFSRRLPDSDVSPTQSLLLRLKVTRRFNPDQVADLLHFSRSAVLAIEGLQEPLISVEEQNTEGCSLLCYGLVAVQSWHQYIGVRESILLRLEEVVEQIHLSQRTIGVSYDTSIEQLDRIPSLILDLVERDPLLKLRSCRLMTIAAFSYEYSFRFHALHPSFGAIKDAINRLNKDLLACFAAEGIEIPYPTAVEIRKPA